MPIFGKTTVITGSNEPYNVAIMPDSIYQWTVVGGLITVGQGTPQIMVNWGPAGATASVSVEMMSTVTNQTTPPDSITVVIDPDEGGDHGKGHKPKK